MTHYLENSMSYIFFFSLGWIFLFCTVHINDLFMDNLSEMTKLISVALEIEMNFPIFHISAIGPWKWQNLAMFVHFNLITSFQVFPNVVVNTITGNSSDIHGLKLNVTLLII